MKRALFLLGFAALIYAPFWLNTYQWNQRMTVTIDTPTGEVSGSSVSHVRWRKRLFHWAEGMGWDYDVTGAAAVIEVLPGKYLFALLKGAGTSEYMGSVAAASISGQTGRVIDAKLFTEVSRKRGRANGVIEVPEYQFPLMVTFADINDPMSVQMVDPANLAASFGPGVSLNRVTLEITREPVSVGRIEVILGWLPTIWPNRLDGRRFGTINSDNRFANSLSANSFSTEIRK